VRHGQPARTGIGPASSPSLLISRILAGRWRPRPAGRRHEPCRQSSATDL